MHAAIEKQSKPPIIWKVENGAEASGRKSPGIGPCITKFRVSLPRMMFSPSMVVPSAWATGVNNRAASTTRTAIAGFIVDSPFGNNPTLGGPQSPSELLATGLCDPSQYQRRGSGPGSEGSQPPVL